MSVQINRVCIINVFTPVHSIVTFKREKKRTIRKPPH